MRFKIRALIFAVVVIAAMLASAGEASSSERSTNMKSISTYLSVEPPIDPPYQPYPWRLVSADGESISSMNELIDALPAALLERPGAQHKGAFLEELLPFLVFLIVRYPEVHFVNLSHTMSVPGLAPGTIRTLIPTPNPGGVRRVTADTVVAFTHCWISVEGLIVRFSVRFDRNIAKSIEFDVVARSVGDYNRIE